MGLAYTATGLGVLAVVCILVDFAGRYSRYGFVDRAFRHNPVDLFNELLQVVPCFSESYNQLRQAAESQENGEPALQRMIEEMAGENQRQLYLESYKHAKETELGQLLLFKAVAIVLVFASLYLADYTARTRCDTEYMPGYVGSEIEGCCWPDAIVESIYYSTVTFVTLGFGDVRPDHYAWPRLLVVAEVVSFLVLFVYGISFGLNFAGRPLLLTREDFIFAIREDLRLPEPVPFPPVQKAPSLEKITNGLLTYASRVPECFHEIGTRFGLDFDEYRDFLVDAIRSVFVQKNGVQNTFSALGIDGLTIHYETRHRVLDGNEGARIIAIGIPTSGRPIEMPQVYQKGMTTYVNVFKDVSAEEGAPRCMCFLEDGVLPEDRLDTPDVLYVHRSVGDALMQFTEGAESQGDLSSDEIEMVINSDTKGDLPNIQRKVCEWIGVDKQDMMLEQILGIVRDSCRLTFLLCKQGARQWPRMVVLAPAYVEHNLVGGMAFVGSKPINNYTHILSLGVFAKQFLATLRLFEERETFSSIKHLDELNAMRALFIQQMAHRITIPLDRLHSTTYQIFNDLLAAQRSSSENKVLKESLNKVEDDIKRLKENATQLIETYESEDPGTYFVIKNRTISIARFLKTLTFVYSEEFKQKGKILDLGIVPHELKICADETVLFDVMANLLSNAVRYAKSRVTLTTERNTKGDVLFRVSDDGPGVSSKVQKGLFHRGVKGDSVGHGYGLFLSRLAMRRHGGDLYLNRGESTGAEFVVEIPGNLVEGEA